MLMKHLEFHFVGRSRFWSSEDYVNPTYDQKTCLIELNSVMKIVNILCPLLCQGIIIFFSFYLSSFIDKFHVKLLSAVHINFGAKISKMLSIAYAVGVNYSS